MLRWGRKYEGTPVVDRFTRSGIDTVVRCPSCAEPTVIEGPDRRIFGKRFMHRCGRAFVVARDAQYDPVIGD